MEDQELFDYFKRRQHTLDEVPGTNLWGRIEAGLETLPETNKRNYSKAVQFGVLVAAVLVISMALNSRFWDGDEVVGHSRAVVPAATVAVIDTVKRDGHAIGDTSHSPVVVTKRSEGHSLPAIKSRVALVPFAPIIFIKDSVIRGDASVPIEDSVLKVTALPGRVIVSTKRQLDKVEFEALVDRILVENKDRPGTLVVVKAPGHIPFRKVIKINSSVVPVYDYKRDSIVLRKTGKGIFVKGGIIVNDSVQIGKDSIRFHD